MNSADAVNRLIRFVKRINLFNDDYHVVMKLISNSIGIAMGYGLEGPGSIPHFTNLGHLTTLHVDYTE
jgi:hypothetical protein